MHIPLPLKALEYFDEFSNKKKDMVWMSDESSRLSVLARLYGETLLRLQLTHRFGCGKN